jgi:hypothetical protein
MSPDYHQTAERARRHIGNLARRHPLAWQQIEGIRKDRKELGDWPQWCFAPLAASYAVVSQGQARISPIEGLDVSRVGALSAWRMTQGIYAFDADLLDALWQTPVEGEIPLDVLYRLPEWCVYVPTPGRSVAEFPLAGFFAHLEYDANDHRTELRLLLDTDTPDGLVPIPLHVWVPGGLAAAVGRFAEEAQFQARLRDEFRDLAPKLMEAGTETARACEPLVSLVLYLCSRNAEIADAKGRDIAPGRSRVQRAKDGRELPAAGTVVWETGYRIGAALRAAQAAASEGDGDSGRSVAPHVRRAHWHHYWTGPKDQQASELRWLSPMLVGAGEIVPTVRKVQE